MSDFKASDNQPEHDSICFAELSDGVVVIRVLGRGNMTNSLELKKIADFMAQKLGPGHYHFIVDLSDCPTMDSTFLGVLASVGLRQRRDNRERLVIVNANEQSSRLMQTLGLTHFVLVRSEGDPAELHLDEGQIKTVEREEISKRERIIHMIEAHQQLCDLSSSNSVEFEGVIKFLQESLKREKP